MAVNYGIDYEIFPDLDLTFTIVSDYIKVLMEDVYKKLTTKPGIIDPATGQFWDTNTMDLKDYLGDQLSVKELNALQTRIISIFETELRYQVNVVVQYINGSLFVAVTIFPSNDETPIKMVFNVTSSNVSFERVI